MAVMSGVVIIAGINRRRRSDPGIAPGGITTLANARSCRW
jgi:hypothetical protein